MTGAVLNVAAIRRAKEILDAQNVPLAPDTMIWCSYCGKTTPAMSMPCCIGFAHAFKTPLPPA